MPLILIFGRSEYYLVVPFWRSSLDTACCFSKVGILASIYPPLAVLILVGFDMSEYAGTTISSTPFVGGHWGWHHGSLGGAVVTDVQ